MRYFSLPSRLWSPAIAIPNHFMHAMATEPTFTKRTVFEFISNMDRNRQNMAHISIEMHGNLCEFE